MRLRLSLALCAVVALALAAVVFGDNREEVTAGSALACAEGDGAQAEDADAPEADVAPTGSAVDDFYSGPSHEVPCAEGPGHPESFADLATANSSRLTRTVAPGTAIKPGAYRAAVDERNALDVTGGSWSTYGKPPLQSNRTDYDTTNGSTNEGLGDLSGRVNAFATDASGTTYAAVSNGGIWKSTDQQHWTSIGDSLPTQVVSGIAWTSAGGGTLIALTGDLAYGGDTYAGLGVYRSSDAGATWTHSAGIPDGLLGFRIVVDPNDPSKVYAATGGGLYRSTDAGASFVNVNLPTGANAPAGTPDCSGQPPTAKNCFLANMVTDVVVQGPANAQSAGGKPGAVMAAVGWRAGNTPNSAGAQQSPGNGIYVSNTGAPGTFTNMDMPGNSTPTTDPLTQARLGRIALGVASGPAQNHQIVYALVQDAVKFNGGALGLDASEPNAAGPAYSDYLNGVWVSNDFGATWKELEGSTTIDNDTLSGSALAPPTCKAPAVISYCPGIQAWYNLWVSPDPTKATATGVPTRLALGLEEVWANDPATLPPTGLDGTTPARFTVIGRYYAGTTCTLLTATNGLPVCPTGTVPDYTTHPDQHAALWVPDGSGGVTLVVGNDGGIYKQHVASGADLANDQWGQGKPQDSTGANVAGANDGLNTLQPYDVAMANDGTAYMGLQDNGEAKIEPDGSMYTIFGGDGFFSAVDPANSNVAYEEYTGGDIAVTTDGGKNWNDIQPSGITSAQFATPFEMDPNNANHLMIGGRDIEETTAGPGTTASTWAKVYDLGTQKHPGDATATSAADDPDNQLSAVDVSSGHSTGTLPTGPKTADVHQTDKGGDTVPGFDSTSGPTGLPTQVPGTYNDYDITVGPKDGDAAMNVDVSWADSADDWDLYLYSDDGSGNLTYVSSSANSGTTEEKLTLPDPPPGKYVVRVVNWEALSTYNLDVTFDQRSAGSPSSNSNAYVGFCGFCDTITQGTPFANGIATNVGGAKPGVAGSPDGWHIAGAQGLPSRYITSVRMDPNDPKTVYVTLAGYGRRWAFPGAVGEDTSKIGTGHVFMSTDAGEHFTDITGNLPDVPANWTVVHNGRLAVGTDIGVFVSCNAAGGDYSVLGNGLPTAPISTMSFKPNDPDLLVAATYGRGIYTYRFDDSQPLLCHGDSTGQPPTLEPFGKGAVDVKIAKKVHRKRKQRVRVKLISRVGSELTGTVRLKAKGTKHHKVAARPKAVHVSLAAAGKKKLRMKIPAAVRRKLKHGHKVRVTAVVKLHDANGRSLTVRKSKAVKRAVGHHH